MRIWKYTVRPDHLAYDASRIRMPKGAVLLTAQLQDGVAAIWAIVNPAAPLVNRKILPVLTGTDADGQAYIGTVQFDNGAFVVHFFDNGES